MANDPANETGPAKDAETIEGVFISKNRIKDRDLQKVDARLRQAVASGDENYVRGRLGGDRVLGEAEMLLIIKTRREAEVNLVAQISSMQAVESAVRAGHEKEEEGIRKWTRNYVATQSAAAAARAQQSAGTTFIDARGLDPYGYKFVSNFGYDRQGNYNDSFGGRLGRDGIYRTERGGEADLRHGVYTSGKDAHNDQTGDVILYNEAGNNYVLMRRNAAGEMAPAEMVDGKPKTMTQQERDMLLEQWRITNRPATDAEMARMSAEVIKLDNERAAAAAGHTAEATTSAEHTADASTPDARSSAASARGDESVPPPPPPAPAPAPDPHRNAGVAMAERGESDIGEARRSLTMLMQRSERTSQWGNQSKRRDEHHRSQTVIGPVMPPGAVSEEEKQRLLGQASASASARAGAPKFALGEGSKDDSTLQTGWVKDDKNGGVWDDKGGYFDTKGGYWDKQGGYYDSKGNYTDQYGGFKSTDGSYMDAKGNFVDKQGNLWLAGNESDKPDFPKKEGVDYIDVLAKAAENRYSKIIRDNPGLTAEEAKELQEKLTKIDNDFKVAHSGPQPVKPEDNTITQSAGSGTGKFYTPAPTVAATEPEKDPTSTTVKRPTATSPSPRG